MRQIFFLLAIFLLTACVGNVASSLPEDQHKAFSGTARVQSVVTTLDGSSTEVGVRAQDGEYVTVITKGITSVTPGQMVKVDKKRSGYGEVIPL